jgi:hypothetical protein
MVTLNLNFPLTYFFDLMEISQISENGEYYLIMIL